MTFALVGRPAGRRGRRSGVPSTNLPGAGKADLPPRAGPTPGCRTTCAARGVSGDEAAAHPAAAAQGGRAAYRDGPGPALRGRGARGGQGPSTAGSRSGRRIPDGPPVYLRLVDEDAMVTRWAGTRRRPAAVPGRRPPARTRIRRRGGSRWWRRRRGLTAGAAWRRCSAHCPAGRLAGPAVVFLFWPPAPLGRGQDGRDASSAQARRLA